MIGLPSGARVQFACYVPIPAATMKTPFQKGGRMPTPRAGRLPKGRPTQKTLMAISAGSASSPSISSSSFTNVMDAPAMSSDVQYSPT